MFAIKRAMTAQEFDQGRDLFREYQASLGSDLCFQSFDRELETLTEMYGHPDGALLLAISSTDGLAAGCVGLRRIDPAKSAEAADAPRQTCEMKRLYVRPAHRGHGLGRLLVEAVLAEALALRYERMRLHTLATMKEARRLYDAKGFREVEPYGEHPVEGTSYLELTLGRT